MLLCSLVTSITLSPELRSESSKVGTLRILKLPLRAASWPRDAVLATQTSSDITDDSGYTTTRAHKRLTIAHGKYHTDQSRAHAYDAYIY